MSCMRIGEILVARGFITADQLQEALRAQVMWGGRLGTALVELQFVSLDDLSRALGVQFGLPAALASHFERADLELQLKLSVDLAERLQCIPLIRAGKRIVIAAAEPLDDKALALVATDLGVDRQMVVQSVAAELRIRYQLELVYGIARPQRYMRARGTTEQSALFRLKDLGTNHLGCAVIGAGTLLPERCIPAEEPPEGTAERRTYLRTLADILAGNNDAARSHPPVQRVDRAAAARPIAIGTDAIAKLDSVVVADMLPEALVEIELSPSREELARRIVSTVGRFVPHARAAMLLLIRGTAAVSAASFCRDGSDLAHVAVPLDHAGLVAAVTKRKVISRGSSGDLSPIDYLLLTSLGLPYGDLVVSPLSIAGHVIGMIVLAVESGGRLDDVPSITSASSAAFGRRMSEAGGESVRPLSRQKPVKRHYALPRTITPN
jgi:hypothetical protein